MQLLVLDSNDFIVPVVNNQFFGQRREIPNFEVMRVIEMIVGSRHGSNVWLFERFRALRLLI